MTTLFNTTFEDNHLYQYPVTNGFHALYVDGGTIEVNVASKNGGSYGCEITPMQYYKACGLQYTEPLSKFRQRFYFNINGLTIADGGSIFIARNHHSDASRILYAVGINRSGSDYRLDYAIADNTETLTSFSGNTTLNKSIWNYVEAYWQAGSPGSFAVYLNGSLLSTLTATNNNNRVIYPALGICHYHSYAISGSFYLDDWTANDDGSEIGA